MTVSDSFSYSPNKIENFSQSGSSLWVDKYSPKSISEIIGNPSSISQIQIFLKNFQKSIETDPAFKRSLLISGAPGIGKSTAANVISRECGYRVIEFNASDKRSKATIENEIKELISNRGLNEFFKVKNNQSNFDKKLIDSRSSILKKSVLILDEIDGMAGNEDRGGIQSVIQLIKKTQIPIICICNDSQSPKIKSLKNYTQNITWKRLPAKQLAPKLYSIAQKEKINLSLESIELMCEQTAADIRQLINLLQIWSKTSKNITHKSAIEKMASGSKDFAVNVFEVISSFFHLPPSIDDRLQQQNDLNNKKNLPKIRNRYWIDHRIESYFVDPQLVPLFIEDSYLSCLPQRIHRSSNIPKPQIDVETMKLMSEAADVISLSDLVDQKSRSIQDYSFMPEHAILSSVYPGFIVSGSYNRQFGFPTWFGEFENDHFVELQS